MTEFQSKPVIMATTTQQTMGVDDCTTTSPTTTTTENTIHTFPILHYLLGLFTFMSECFTGWREFEDDLIIYSKSTRTKQLVSSFILLLFLILTIWVYRKLKIF